MGKALRRRTFRKSPRVYWWLVICWSVLGLLFAFVAAGFAFIFLVVA